MKKRAHRGLYHRNGFWYIRFVLDGKTYRYSTEIPATKATPPKEVLAMVPRGREQKEKARSLCRRTVLATRAVEGPVILSKFVAEYLNLKPIPPSIKSRRSILRGFVAFYPAGTEIGQINRPAALRYHQHLAELCAEGEIAGSTANCRLASARSLFSHAIRMERYEGANPFSGFRRFEENHREFTLERGDIAPLLAACPSYLSHIVSDNLYLGLRAGEIRAFQRADFRPNEGAHGYILINVAQTKAGRLKVAQGARLLERTVRIALTPEVRNRMARRPVNFTHKHYYSGPNGKPVAKRTLERGISEAWAKALPEIAKVRGVEPSELGPFTFHNIRHTAATWDAMAGFTEDELMQKYRWADRRMVSRYVHPSDEWAEAAAMKRANG